jgi:hypothetical protein
VTYTRRSSGMPIERDQPTRRYDLVPGCMRLFYLAGLGRSGERAERLLDQPPDRLSIFVAPVAVALADFGGVVAQDRVKRQVG